MSDSVNSFTESMTYDANGNMTQWGYREGDGALYAYTYDAFGRLTKAQGTFSPELGKYRYNGLGFRIMHQYDADMSHTALTDSERYYFMYDERWRIIGTFRNQDADPKESFVYHTAGKAGRGDASYIDSVILRDRDTTNGWTGDPNGSLEERRFYCQNWRADVVAVTKSDGLPLEFIRYTSYGKAQVFAAADVNRDGYVNATDADDWDDIYTENPSGAAIPVDFNFDGSTFDPTDYDDFNDMYTLQSGFSSFGNLSTLGNRKGYAGYEFDQPVEAYHVRNRVYLPEIGRWTKRDPVGYVDGMSLYQYVRSMALRFADQTGLCSLSWGCAWDLTILAARFALLATTVAACGVVGSPAGAVACAILLMSQMCTVIMNALDTLNSCCPGTIPPASVATIASIQNFCDDVTLLVGVAQIKLIADGFKRLGIGLKRLLISGLPGTDSLQCEAGFVNVDGQCVEDPNDPYKDYVSRRWIIAGEATF